MRPFNNWISVECVSSQDATRERDYSWRIVSDGKLEMRFLNSPMTLEAVIAIRFTNSQTLTSQNVKNVLVFLCNDYADA